MTGRSREFAEEAKRRRDDLRQAIAKAFPEFERVTVEFGTISSVGLDGSEGRLYSFSVKVYEDERGEPTKAFDFGLSATDLEIARTIESWIGKRAGGS